MVKPQCVVYSNDFKGGIEFIEDQTEWPHKWDRNVMFYDVIKGSRSITLKNARKALNFSMTTWDTEVDLDFHPVWFRKWNFKTHDITIEFKSSLEDNYFRDKPSVLAYAYLPGQGSVSGRIVFNDDYLWGLTEGSITVKKARERGYPVQGNPPDDQPLKIYSVVQVLIHELGHMLGLTHDVSGNRDGVDVMDALYDGRRFDLSERDIERIHLKYPVEIFGHESHYKRWKRWLRRRVRRFKLI